MQLIDVSIADRSGVRFHEAVYRAARGAEYRVYFAIDSDWPDPGHTDHFFILGATQAYLIGEPYRQAAPVTRPLARNMRAIQKQWRQWSGRAPVALEVEERSAGPDAPAGASGRAAFFSGGIDSFFTELSLGPTLDHLVSLEHRPADRGAIDDAFGRLREMTPYIESTGRRHLRIVTNMMTEMPEVHDAWAFLAHGGALAAVAHVLSGGLERVYVSSSHDYGNLLPWGSHPLTDPLFSSGPLAIEHYGAEYTRLEKTAAIAHSPAAMAMLSVCGKGRLAGRSLNCSRCQKCLRTMLCLDLLGVDRSTATSFDWTHYRTEDFGRIFLRGVNEFVFARELRDGARERHRPDVERAARRAIARSMAFRPLALGEAQARLRLPWIARHKRSLTTLRDGTYLALGLRKSLSK